jgi:hypothetical protein
MPVDSSEFGSLYYGQQRPPLDLPVTHPERLAEVLDTQLNWRIETHDKTATGNRDFIKCSDGSVHYLCDAG